MVVYLLPGMTRTEAQLMNLKPFKQDNLKDKCLADHLRDLDHLNYIYLDQNNIVTKDEVFERNYVGPRECQGIKFTLN